MSGSHKLKFQLAEPLSYSTTKLNLHNESYRHTWGEIWPSYTPISLVKLCSHNDEGWPSRSSRSLWLSDASFFLTLSNEPHKIAYPPFHPHSVLAWIGITHMHEKEKGIPGACSIIYYTVTKLGTFFFCGIHPKQDVG